MKFKKFFYLSSIFAFLLSSCSKDHDFKEDFKPTTYNVSGKVEKGPFVSGSTITIQPMDGTLQVLGSLYSSSIIDDLGNFSFGSKLFEAPYAELTVNGCFFDEVKGKSTSSALNLRALVDLSDGTTVNVNILTHLKYQRIQKLVADGMKFKKANIQAQKELFTAFGLQKYAGKDASTFSISGGTDESAALIAISSLLLVDKSEAAVTEYLTKLCREFGEKGTFEKSTRQQINEDKKSILNKLPSIRDNIIEHYESLGLNVEVKNLEQFIDWNDDGIAGNEILQEGQEIKPEITELNVPNNGGSYTIKILSPIPVYLESAFDDVENIVSDDFFSEFYDENTSYNISLYNISMALELANNILTVNIYPLYSRTTKTSDITIYDSFKNVVGNIKITQEGNDDIHIPIPQLGKSGQLCVSSILIQLAQCFSELNVIEQYYHYNKEYDLVKKYVFPYSSTIENIWSHLYSTYHNIMFLKNAEAERLGVYQEYFDVFCTMLYYNMIVAWGDVPYNISNIDIHNITRTPSNEIFADLKNNLEKAIDYFEEKRNEYYNDVFFLSKDVARILLADIHMYQGNYIQAEKLFGKVISNGFYNLDDSNYNNLETITDMYDNKSNQEVIFATLHFDDKTINDKIPIVTPKCVPTMNYTDVVLSYAECLYKNGKSTDAEKQLSQVTNAKSINVSGNNILEKIKDARLQLMLYTNTNFAFMKRNGFAEDTYNIEKYQTLLPIPQRELQACPRMTQNPGY